MRLTTTRAEAFLAKATRARRSIVAVKADLRTMRPVAKGGDLQALDTVMPSIITAEAAVEAAETALTAMYERMARKDHR
jgi:hypothetical protein